MTEAVTDALFRVEFAGPFVTIQDGGRRGMMRYGLPASGAMDRRALKAANAALGNDPGAAGIEVSLGCVMLRCLSGRVTLAVAGGGFIVEAGGQRGGSWQVMTVTEGDRIAIRRGPWGSWCCLTFAGTLEVPQWLGSRSTHAASGLGGGILRNGQELRVTGARVLAGAEGPIPCPVWARPRRELRMVMGPQDRFFPAEARAAFTEGVYRLTAAYDRMGVRLAGPPLVPESALGIPSEPILRGSVQVAGDGVPTVLLADHQTTGGYPKIATLVSSDTDAFAQCRPGDPVVFHPVDPDRARQIARQDARVQGAYLDRLGARLLP